MIGELYVMSKLSNLIVSEALAPFENILGEVFPKIENDVKSMLGRIKDNEIESNLKKWKATAGFKLKSSEGYTVQLAPNNPAVILLCFGMRLNEISEAGDFDVQATIPKACKAWVEEHSKTVHTEVAAPARK